MLAAGCSAPARTPQQVLRELTPSSVLVTGLPLDGARVGPSVKGAEVALADVAIRVEEAEKTNRSDLSSPSVDDALARRRPGPAGSACRR